MASSKEQEERIQRNNEAIERQAWEAAPVDVFADVIELFDDDPVARMTFRCSRPDISDPLGGVTVVTARVTMPWRHFNAAVKKFQARMQIYDGEPDMRT